ncbi:MAG: MFS transporter, partial [Thermoguttaceae bacterium]|nr:MFS transporter [Thermoguttaceae bacterium]
MSAQTKRFSLIYVVIVAALGGLLFGFDSGVISGCEQAIQNEYQLNNSRHGFTVAVALIGTIMGAFGFGRPADIFGRKKTLVAMAVMFFVSAVGCAFAPNWLTLVFMRWLGGVAIGGASVVVPLYIVEVSPGDVRGRLVALNQLNIVFGILLSYASNYFVAKIPLDCALGGYCVQLGEMFGQTGEAAFASGLWRLMLGVEAIPAAAFFFLLFSIPESPRQLARWGRIDDALAVLRGLGDKGAEKTLDEIVESFKNAKSGESEPLFQKAYAMPIFLAWAVAMFNQLSGINAINYYAPRIFEMFVDSESALAATVGLGAVNLIATIAALFLIDKFGRRFLLLLGAVGTTIMHFIAAWQIGLGEAASPTIVIPAITLFILFF